MRLEKLRSYMREKNISKVLLINLEEKPNPNFLYFTSYHGCGVYLIPQKGIPLLIVPMMESQRAKRSKNKVLVCRKRPFFDCLKKYCRGKNIGIDHGIMTLAVYDSIRKSLPNKNFADISPICRRIRSVKSDEEIKQLRNACSITDAIFRRCVRKFRTFKTEEDVSSFLIRETNNEGCELSFMPIVASGANSASPHHIPEKKKLKRGFCIIDFGVRYKGYCSDMTRTLYLGKPSARDLVIYKKLLEVQKSTIAYSVSGRMCSDIYRFSVEKLGHYAGKFIHGLGHGVGLEVHELPNLGFSSEDVLEDGMVFTIEPGVYFEHKAGIRIEDTLLIKDGRPEILTRTSKELKIIKK